MSCASDYKYHHSCNDTADDLLASTSPVRKTVDTNNDDDQSTGVVTEKMFGQLEKFNQNNNNSSSNSSGKNPSTTTGAAIITTTGRSSNNHTATTTNPTTSQNDHNSSDLISNGTAHQALRNDNNNNDTAKTTIPKNNSDDAQKTTSSTNQKKISFGEVVNMYDPHEEEDMKKCLDEKTVTSSLRLLRNNNNANNTTSSGTNEVTTPTTVVGAPTKKDTTGDDDDLLIHNRVRADPFVRESVSIANDSFVPSSVKHALHTDSIVSSVINKLKFVNREYETEETKLHDRIQKRQHQLVASENEKRRRIQQHHQQQIPPRRQQADHQNQNQNQEHNTINNNSDSKKHIVVPPASTVSLPSKNNSRTASAPQSKTTNTQNKNTNNTYNNKRAVSLPPSSNNNHGSTPANSKNSRSKLASFIPESFFASAGMNVEPVTHDRDMSTLFGYLQSADYGGEFEPVAQLGQGSYGQVFIVYWHPPQQCFDEQEYQIKKDQWRMEAAQAEPEGSNDNNNNVEINSRQHQHGDDEDDTRDVLHDKQKQQQEQQEEPALVEKKHNPFLPQSYVDIDELIEDLDPSGPTENSKNHNNHVSSSSHTASSVNRLQALQQREQSQRQNQFDDGEDDKNDNSHRQQQRRNYNHNYSSASNASRLPHHQSPEKPHARSSNLVVLPPQSRSFAGGGSQLDAPQVAMISSAYSVTSVKSAAESMTGGSTTTPSDKKNNKNPAIVNKKHSTARKRYGSAHSSDDNDHNNKNNNCSDGDEQSDSRFVVVKPASQSPSAVSARLLLRQQSNNSNNNNNKLLGTKKETTSNEEPSSITAATTTTTVATQEGDSTTMNIPQTTSTLKEQENKLLDSKINPEMISKTLHDPPTRLLAGGPEGQFATASTSCSKEFITINGREYRRDRLLVLKVEKVSSYVMSWRKKLFKLRQSVGMVNEIDLNETSNANGHHASTSQDTSAGPVGQSRSHHQHNNNNANHQSNNYDDEASAIHSQMDAAKAIKNFHPLANYQLEEPLPAILDHRLVEASGASKSFRMKEEASLLSTVAHPNIIGYVDSFFRGGNQMLLLEYIDGSDLEREFERAKSRRASVFYPLPSCVTSAISEYYHRAAVALATAAIVSNNNNNGNGDDFSDAEQQESNHKHKHRHRHRHHHHHHHHHHRQHSPSPFPQINNAKTEKTNNNNNVKLFSAPFQKPQSNHNNKEDGGNKKTTVIPTTSTSEPLDDNSNNESNSTSYLEQIMQSQQSNNVNNNNNNSNTGGPLPPNGYLLADDVALLVFVQAVLAVEYLHRHNILHRDLKSANIIMSKCFIAKLIDFGTSQQYDVNVSRSIASGLRGSPLSIAPEVWARSVYSEKSDMFSLGVLAYYLFEETYPWLPAHFNNTNNDNDDNNNNNDKKKQNNAADIRSLILHEKPRSMKRVVSRDIIKMVASLLSREPERRPTALNLLQDFPCMRRAFDIYMIMFSNLSDVEMNPSATPADRQLVSILKDHQDSIYTPNSLLKRKIMKNYRRVKKLLPPNDDKKNKNNNNDDQDQLKESNNNTIDNNKHHSSHNNNKNSSVAGAVVCRSSQKLRDETAIARSLLVQSKFDLALAERKSALLKSIVVANK